MPVQARQQGNVAYLGSLFKFTKSHSIRCLESYDIEARTVCAMSRDKRENTLDIKDTYEPCALPAQLFSSMGQNILL